MPLPEDFFDTPIGTTPTSGYARDIFPEFEEEDIAAKGSAYDAIGEFLWSTGAHFVSGGTLGLTEFIAPTKSWEEKTTAERMGAAVGEAAGFFVPMAAIGKGVRGAMTLAKSGSKGIAKAAIGKSVSKIEDAALKTAATKGLTKGIFSKEGKRLLYQHELGGEVLERVNRDLMTNTEAALREGIKKAGLQADDATVGTVMKSLQEGLQEGRHINSVSSWLHGKIAPKVGAGPVAQWLAKYTGEVAQDVVTLGIQGVASNAIHAAAREDIDLAPGSSLGHALMLSVAFPAIRAIGGGGERRIGELWGIVRAKHGKTDYTKLAAGEDAANNLRGLLGIITGGKRKNLLGKTEWTGKSGDKYHVDDFANLNFKNKKVFDDAVDILKQIQGSIGKLDGAKIWGKAYFKDTIKPGTIARIALGSAVMNNDMFRDNAAMFRHLPPEEVLTHMLIGGMMSRGKGGWARDPKSRTGDAKAEQLNDYFQMMHLLGIDHSKVSNYVKVKNFQDVVMSNHMGLVFDPTAQEIERIFKKYENLIATDEKYKYDRTEKSSKEINDPVEEWKLLRDAVGLMREEGYDGTNYNLLTPEDKASLREDLKKVIYKDKPLKDVSYNKFMQAFSLEQAETSGTVYKNYLERLGRESFEGADDKVLDGYIDNQGRLNHGGINWEHESSDIAELRSLLHVLENRGMAVKISGEQFKTIDYAENPRALARLERLSKEFREQQKQMGLGDGVNYTFNIGDPQSNPFLRSWLQSRMMEGQSRIANIVTKTGVKEMERADSGFMDVIAREFADEDGAILFPTKYRVVNEEGKEIDDAVLQDQIYGIASALYQGAPKTRRFSDKGSVEVPEDIARQIVGAYEDLNLAIPAESLKDPAHLEYIELRAYEKVDKRPENIRVIRKLEEENLAVVDKEEGRILVNSDAAIRNLADKELNPEQVEELVAAHREIVGTLGNNVEEVGKIGFPMEPDRLINVESLLAIRKMLPGIFEKEVRSEVTKMWNNPERITRLDTDELEGELDLLSENLKVMNFDAAFKNLESLRKRLPGFEETFEKLYDEILTKQQEGQPLELEIFELSKGTGNVYRAMQEYVASEKLASQAIERYLVQLVYRGGDYRSVSDYNRLVDNLLTSIGAGTEKVSLEELLGTYLQRNSYESLQNLMRGVNQLHAGRKMSNDIDNTHLTDAMEQMFQNYTDSPNKTKISIARDYGLLDLNGDISPLSIERLRAGDFETIKRNIAPDKLTDRVDEDLFWLSEIIRNSREQKIVRLTETITEDGKHVMVREWVMPWDNVEFNTPANKAMDVFGENGVEIFPISKSGIIDGWQQQEISYDLSSKAKLENNNTQDMPESKYLTDIIKKGGQLTHEDMVNRDIEMPTGPMKFIEVSLGRPLLLVENDASVEALNNMYRGWYEIYKLRFPEDSQQRRNFERVFDPNKVVDNEVKVRAMYSSMLNDIAFDNLWTPESIEALNTSDGLYGLSNKLMKYNKLGEGGSLKPLPPVDRLELLIDNLPDLPPNRVESIRNIITEIRENPEGITSGFYADEVVGMENPLSVRTRHLSQLDNIQNAGLREHLRERYASGDESRFKNVMDVSSIDGAQYIDGDMRNLLLTVLAESDFVNGFKGSISKSGNQDLINLYGKGLFIYDPVIATAMEAKGVRILQGESSAKNYGGNALSGEPVAGRVAESLDLSGDIANLGNGNIMRISLESIGVRYGGHLSNNSPVPHPYTHYMPENLVLAVRDGWQMLGTKIGEIKRFGRALNMAANEELAMAIKRQRETQGYMHEMDAVSFAEAMLNMGATTRNPVIREAVMKMWEENALPILLKPRNPKFSYPFLVPDLNSAHPIGIDVYRRGDPWEAGEVSKPNAHVRIQLGEGTLGEDARHVPVGSVNELAFSFRSNDVDYLIKYNKKKDKFLIYTPAKEYSDKGHRFDISSQVGERAELEFLTDANQIPSEIQSFIKHLGDVISRGVAPESTVVGSTTRRPSLMGIQDYIENLINSGVDYSKSLVKNQFNLVQMVERGPRKGMSDFVPVRIRIRPQAEKDAGGIGTATGLNALDTRSNMQGDHDGDHVRTTHDFSPHGPKATEGKWEFLKNAYKLAGNNEEYTTVEAGTRPLNLFGIGVDRMGDLTHAGSRTNDNIYEYKAKMLADQRAVGKVIGLQGAIEWGSLGDLSIDGVRLNAKLGYDVDNLINYGDIFRRFEKGNQSVVDFIGALDETLVEKPYSYMLNGEGEPVLKGKLMELPDNSIQMDILYEVIDILRAPSSIFNQEFSEMGSRNATAYDIQSHYTNIMKFFNSPNQVVFNRLINKYRRGDVSFEQKLNELVPLFFQTEDGKDVMVSNMSDLKSKILQGKIFPNKNVIQFGEKDLKKLMRKSNVGFVMDEIVQNSMFKSQELDLAWAHVDGISRVKKGTELFVDEITMLKVLGISQDQMLENRQSAFTVGRQEWLKNAERASLMYDILGGEESFLTGKLEYQLGFGKHANKQVVNSIVDRLDSIAAARNVIEMHRKTDLLAAIREKQDTYKKKFTKKAGRIKNNEKKPQVVYRIVGKLYDKDGNPDWKALKYVDTIQPGRSSKKMMGEFLVLENPIVGHRLSRESTLDGLTWNFVHNSIPQFINKTTFDSYEREAARVAIGLKEVWRNALVEFRNNKGFIGNIFGRAERNKLMMLNNYFKSTVLSKETELAVSEQHLIGDLGEQGSLLYYKAKLLLRPDPIPNHYVEGQVELPRLALNDRIFKEVFTWLHNNNQKEVATKLLKEYTDIKNYLSGFTNESTFELHPSPLYRTKWNIDPDRANETVLSILDGVVTPDIQVRLMQKGIGMVEGDVIYSKKGEGGYEIREIRDLFSNWKEGKVDKRISCRP